MQYRNDIFIIDLRFEILSMLQSIAFKNAMWIKYSQDFYIDKLREQINMNSEVVGEIITFLGDKDLRFSKLAQIVTAMDEDSNLDIKYLENNGYDISKIKTFEVLIKKLFEENNITDFYIKWEEFYTNKLKNISDFLKDIDMNDIYNFYGYKIGDFKIVVSFISGNFGIRYNNNLYCYKFFKLDQDFNLIFKKTIIPFIYHEFSHPYVSEIISKHSNKLSFVENHYNAIFNEKLSPYRDVNGLLEEIIVRANEIYLSKKYMDEDSKNYYIQKQVDNNIYYFRELINLYEINFNKYSIFERFFVNEIIPYYLIKFNK